MFIAIQLIGYLAVCLLFGYGVSRTIFGFRNLHTLLPLSILIGLGGNIFLLNITSYFSPIHLSIWGVLLGMLIISAILLYKSKNDQAPRNNLTERQTKLFVGIAVFISLISGLVALKSLALDDTFMG